MRERGGAAADAVIVVILPDGGRNYLSKLYNDEWMRANGLLPATGGVVRDAAAAGRPPPWRGERPPVVVARTTQRVGEVIETLQAYGISQLPVSEQPDGRRASRASSARSPSKPARPGVPQPRDRRADRRRGDGPAAAGRRPRRDARRRVHAALGRRGGALVAIGDGRPAGIVTKLDLLEYLAHRPVDRGSGHDPRRRSTSVSFDTLAVHAGAEPDELTGAVSPPIYQTSTYAQDGVGRPRRGYEYSRSQNPTRERLERAVAALEGGRHGIAFAAGSAVTAAIAQFAPAGDGDRRRRRRLRRHVPVPRAGAPAGRGRGGPVRGPRRAARTSCGRPSPSGRAWSGSRRRPTRC